MCDISSRVHAINTRPTPPPPPPPNLMASLVTFNANLHTDRWQLF